MSGKLNKAKEPKRELQVKLRAEERAQGDLRESLSEFRESLVDP